MPFDEAIKKRELVFQKLKYLMKDTGHTPDWDDAIAIAEIFEGDIEKLTYHLDVTTGLWATDQDPKEFLQNFWQRTSDACPLVCEEAEKQEIEFREWVKGRVFQIEKSFN